MTIGEYYTKMQERRPVRRECSTCADMPVCWLHGKTDDLGAVRDCWRAVPVPDYIKDIELKLPSK